MLEQARKQRALRTNAFGQRTTASVVDNGSPTLSVELERVVAGVKHLPDWESVVRKQVAMNEEVLRR